MPLQTIIVDYGKQESIFEKLNPFVDKLVNLYNDKKMQEWNNQWMTMALKDIDKASDQETIDALFAKQNPPSEWMDTEGFTEFAKGAVGSLTMGPVQQKEIMTGGLSPETIVPEQPEPIEPQLMPDKMEWNELYKFVSELPTGQVDWSSTLNIFQQRLESKKKLGDMATQFLNQILGQGVPDQRAKFASDVELTNYLKQTLYPETETRLPSSEMELFLTAPEVYKQYQQAKKAGEPQVDLEALSQWIVDNNMQITGGTFNPTTNNLSYSFQSKDTKKPFEQVIKEAENYVKNHPNMQISNINFETESVSVGQKPKEAIPTAPKSRVNDILFGDTGIIPKFIKDETIDMNMPLSDEEKATIIKNYNIKKPTLTAEEINEIEQYFRQIGVDPYATPEEIDIYAGREKKWYEFWEGVEGMSEDQLKEAVMKGDKKAIEEARRRGYIK